jgi:hypothetical protein
LAWQVRIHKKPGLPLDPQGIQQPDAESVSQWFSPDANGFLLGQFGTGWLLLHGTHLPLPIFWNMGADAYNTIVTKVAEHQLLNNTPSPQER